MKKLILASFLFTAFVSHADENQSHFQPTAISDCLYITGATTFAAVEPFLGAASWITFFMGMDQLCNKDDFAAAFFLFWASYGLDPIGKRLAKFRQLSTNCTSTSLQPLSLGLQDVASSISIIATVAAILYYSQHATPHCLLSE